LDESVQTLVVSYWNLVYYTGAGPVFKGRVKVEKYAPLVKCQSVGFSYV
jgi:hypothetical protein